MNSPKKFNYETRPHKFTERKMLLASLQKICNYFGGIYQYIGLGGISFTDFKLFHKELHINELCSIEGGKFSEKRLHFNSPYSFIKIRKTISTIALNEIDLTKKTLIWLDYDDTLNLSMFDDIRILFSKLPVGSIYIMTCNRELKEKETREEYSKEKFKDEFGTLTPYEIENIDFSSENNFRTIQRMLNSHINNIVRERNNIEEIKIEFSQLYNILYQENQGARMFTYGGIIISKEFRIEEIGLEVFDFIVDNVEPYIIKIPNLTRKEFELIDSHLFLKEEELLAKGIVSSDHIDQYKKVYKYIPHFYDIRM